MLDKNTLEWLEERKPFVGKCHTDLFCRYCGIHGSAPEDRNCLYVYCPTDSRLYETAMRDWLDAVEFEARVAKKLSIERGYIGEDGVCTIGTHCPNMLCEECRLKYTRIRVEEEMENARQEHA